MSAGKLVVRILQLVFSSGSAISKNGCSLIVKLEAEVSKYSGEGRTSSRGPVCVLMLTGLKSRGVDLCTYWISR